MLTQCAVLNGRQYSSDTNAIYKYTLYFVWLVELLMQLTCDILCRADNVAFLRVAVPPQVVVADLDVVLLRHLLVLVEAGLLEGVPTLLVLRRLEHRLVFLVAGLRGDVVASVEMFTLE